MSCALSPINSVYATAAAPIAAILNNRLDFDCLILIQINRLIKAIVKQAAAAVDHRIVTKLNVWRQ